MTKTQFNTATTAWLVDEFAALCLLQQQALDEDDIDKYNRLYLRQDAVVEELKIRAGDRRRDLLPLVRHENIQVRLMVAQVALALAPAEARAVLEQIRDSREMPQALDAGMALFALDEGIYTPS